MIPILIGGTGRSGTTVLKELVSRHPDVASFPFELRIVVDPGGLLDTRLALTDRWSPYAADIAIQRLEALLRRSASTGPVQMAAARLLNAVGISPPSYNMLGVGNVVGTGFYRQRRAELIGSLEVATNRNVWAGTPSFRFRARMHDTSWPATDDVDEALRRFLSDLFSRTPGGADATHWVEDTPYNILHAAELVELFPKLRLVHVYRDFRDVAASYRRQRWGGGEVIAIANRLRGIVSRWRALRDRLPAETFLEVRLEQAVADPVALMNRLCEFTHLRPSPEMESALSRLSPRTLHEGRWRTEFSPQEQQTIQSCLASELSAYGYE